MTQYDMSPRVKARSALADLKRRTHRSAVALLLYEPDDAPDWNTVALTHSLGQCDYVELMLGQINSETQFLNIDADSERNRLSGLAESPSKHACILVMEFDVALSRISHDERVRLWNNLLVHFPHRNSALLIAMPQGATHLLPDPDLWSDAGKAILLVEL